MTVGPVEQVLVCLAVVIAGGLALFQYARVLRRQRDAQRARERAERVLRELREHRDFTAVDLSFLPHDPLPHGAVELMKRLERVLEQEREDLKRQGTRTVGRFRIGNGVQSLSVAVTAPQRGGDGHHSAEYALELRFWADDAVGDDERVHLVQILVRESAWKRDLLHDLDLGAQLVATQRGTFVTTLRYALEREDHEELRELAHLGGGHRTVRVAAVIDVGHKRAGVADRRRIGFALDAQRLLLFR